MSASDFSCVTCSLPLKEKVDFCFCPHHHGFICDNKHRNMICYFHNKVHLIKDEADNYGPLSGCTCIPIPKPTDSDNPLSKHANEEVPKFIVFDQETAKPDPVPMPWTTEHAAPAFNIRKTVDFTMPQPKAFTFPPKQTKPFEFDGSPKGPFQF